MLSQEDIDALLKPVLVGDTDTFRTAIDAVSAKYGAGKVQLIAGVRGRFGQTILHMAAATGHQNMVVLALSYFTPEDWYIKELFINRPDGAFNDSAFNIAARRGHMGIMRVLHENGARVTYPDFDGDTALHEAAERGNCEIAKYLLDLGIEKDSVNRAGKTPLLHAVFSGTLLVVNVLQAHGCGPRLSSFPRWARRDLLQVVGRRYIENHYGEDSVTTDWYRYRLYYYRKCFDSELTWRFGLPYTSCWDGWPDYRTRAHTF